jgi:VanZ family protein
VVELIEICGTKEGEAVTKDKKGSWRLIVSWIAVLAWMGFIFSLSSQAAEESGKLSAGITEAVIRVIKMVAPHADLDIDVFNHIVRKCAHFVSYLVLGLLAMNALRRSGITGRRRIAVSLLICILYAASDEVHQLFVPGRAGQVKDVLIDSAGSSLGIASYSLFRNKKHKNGN